MAASQRTARFLTGLALHEDLRYVRSNSKNPLMRTAHALAFTFVDKTDSGRNTIAFSNFAGAAAGGFVAAWLQRFNLRRAKNRLPVHEHRHSERSRRISTTVGTHRAKTTHPENPSRMVGTAPRKLTHWHTPFQFGERNRIRICAQRKANSVKSPSVLPGSPAFLAGPNEGKTSTTRQNTSDSLADFR